MVAQEGGERQGSDVHGEDADAPADLGFVEVRGLGVWVEYG